MAVKIVKVRGLQPVPSSPPPDSRRRMLGMALLAALAWGAVVGVHGVRHRRFEALKLQMKARGVPVSLAEFQEADIPNDQYAYPALRKALDGLDPAQFDRLKHPGLQVGPWNPGTRSAESSAVAPYLPRIAAEIAPALRKSRRLAKIDYIRWSRNPLTYDGPRLTRFIFTAEVLGLDANLRSYRGDAAGAWRDVRLILAMKELVGQTHGLIAGLISVVLQNIATKSVIDMQFARPSPRMPDDVAESFRRFLNERCVVHGMQAEVAQRLDELRFMEQASAGDAAFMDESAHDSWPGIVEYLLLRKAGLYDISGMKLIRLEISDSWPNDWASLKEQAAREAKSPTRSYASIVHYGPKVAGFLQREWAARTWVRMALILRAAREYKAAHAAFPATLERMSPQFISSDLLIDAFTGQRYGYSVDRAGSKFELTSSGPKGDSKDFKNVPFLIRFPN